MPKAGDAWVDIFANLAPFRAEVGKLVTPALAPLEEAIKTQVGGAFQAAGQEANQALSGTATNAEGLRDVVSEIGSAFQGVGTQANEALSGSISTASGLQDAVTDVGGAFQGVGDAATDVSGTFAETGEVAVDAMGQAKDATEDLEEAVADTGETLADKITEPFADFGKKLFKRLTIALVLRELFQFGRDSVKAYREGIIADGEEDPLAPLIASWEKFQVQIGQIIGEVLVALGPLLEELTPVLVLLAEAFGEVFQAIIPLLGPVAEILIALTPIIQVAVDLAVVLLKVLEPAIRAIGEVVEWVVARLINLMNGLRMVVNVVIHVANAILDVIGEIINAIDVALGPWINLPDVEGGIPTIKHIDIPEIEDPNKPGVPGVSQPGPDLTGGDDDTLPASGNRPALHDVVTFSDGSKRGVDAAGNVWIFYPGFGWIRQEGSSAAASIPSLADGGRIEQDGLVRVHAGETVTPAQVAPLSEAPMDETHYHVHVGAFFGSPTEARKLARELSRLQTRDMQRGLVGARL